MAKNFWEVPAMGSSEYFSQNVLNPNITAALKKLHRNTPYENHRQMELLYIRHGCGKIYINQEEYAFERGMLFVLNPLHFHRIEPDLENIPEAYIFHINISTFIYLITGVYYQADVMLFLQDQLFIRAFDEKQASEAEKLCDEFLCEQKGRDELSIQSSIFIFMRIIGLSLKI